MDFLAEAALMTVLIPAIAAGAVALFFRGRWALPAALFAGYVAAQCGIDHVPPFPPRVAHEWIPWLLLLAGTLGIEKEGERSPLWRRIAPIVVLSALLLWPLLKPRYEEGGIAEVLPWGSGLLVSIALAWVVLDRLSQRVPAPWTLGVGSFTATAAAIAIVLSGSAKIAQLGGGLAAASGALCLVALFRRETDAVNAPVPGMFFLAQLSLIGNGYFFAELPAFAAVLLAASLVLLLALAPKWAARRVTPPSRTS